MNHIHDVVKVLALFDPEKKNIVDGLLPLKFEWRNREYIVSEVNLHSIKTIEGIINHVFLVIAGGSVLELNFNTKNLVWTLEGIRDLEEGA